MAKRTPPGPARDFPNDPNAAAEHDKYERPVPSREFILDMLAQHPKPLTHEQLCGLFAIYDDPERAEALRRRLLAMVRDRQLDCDRRGGFEPVREEALIRGKVTGHPDGFGFLVPADGSPDLLLTSREMRTVFHGDEVLVRETGYDYKGRREGQVVRVVVRNTTHLVGRYFEEHGEPFVLPDNPRLTQEIALEGETLGAEIGQFVQVAITEPPTHRYPARGRVTEVLGDYMAPGMEIEIALRSFGIPHQWSEAVEQEVAKLSPEVAERDKAGRVDLRDIALVTIDGEDARDFDDAVFAEKRKGGGYRLVVAIADVSHYVREGTALDQEAKDRANSVYFPQHVVPMLPEILSNGLCSLNPHVDRLCMVCDMNISAGGKVTAFNFYEAVMHSQARLTYTQVGALLQEPASQLGQQVALEHPQLVVPLQALYALYQTLREAREKRGALDFESTETRIIFSEDRKIERIVPVVRNDAHKLIEECMLAANVCAAAFVAKVGLPALYRNHEGPRDEKLNKLRQFLGALGIPFTAASSAEPADYQAVLEHIEGRPDAHIIQTLLLRSMMQAYYGPNNLGHFGLNYKAYAHFTSPIRRYPDLLLHRAIRAELQGRGAAFALAHAGSLEGMGEHCSMTERRADEATRDVMAWLKCEYMQDHVGDEFAGVVTAVTGFGFFVELSEVYVEGLVHISTLGNDFYVYDPAMHCLRGERSGIGFSMGEPVRVRVAAVNLDERKMDFQLIEGGSLRRGRVAKGERAAPAAKGKKGGGKGEGKVAAAKSAGKAPAKAKSEAKGAAKATVKAPRKPAAGKAKKGAR